MRTAPKMYGEMTEKLWSILYTYSSVLFLLQSKAVYRIIPYKMNISQSVSKRYGVIPYTNERIAECLCTYSVVIKIFLYIFRRNKNI